jgi:hypothetical protein
VLPSACDKNDVADRKSCVATQRFRRQPSFAVGPDLGQRYAREVRPRYLFDQFCDRLATNTEHAIAAARTRVKKPLRRIVFWKDAAETLIPQEIALFASTSNRHEDADLVVALPRPRTAIPGHVDRAREDGWGDTLDLYRLLLSRELHQALAAAAPREKATRHFSDPDGIERLDANLRSYDRHVRRALAASGSDTSNVRDLAARCFADRRAQSWLTALAPKPSPKAAEGPRWKRYFMARPTRGGARETLYFEVLGSKVILYVECKYVSEHPKTRAPKLIAERKRDGWKKLAVE